MAISPSIMTLTGRAKLASATPEQQLHVAFLAVGDGGGDYSPLDESMTSLVRETWRGPASPPMRDPGNESVLMFEAIIPANAGGFFLREVAIFDSDGAMIAIGQTSLIEKVGADGATPITLTVRFRLSLSNTQDVTLFYQDTPIITHSSVSGRADPGAHPMHAITGLTGVDAVSRAGTMTQIPATVGGAVELRAPSAATFVLPKLSTLAGDIDITLYQSVTAPDPLRIEAFGGDDLVLPEHMTPPNPNYGGIFFPVPGSWIRLRSSKSTGKWVAIAGSAQLANPEPHRRGMPKLATEAGAESGYDTEGMMTAFLVLKLIRAAAAKATTVLRGALRIATQMEVDGGTEPEAAVTPATLAARTPTESRTGIARMATLAEVYAGESDVGFVTPKKLKDSGFWPLGVGQSWQDVTASRAAGVTYTNTTGRPIVLSVSSGVTGYIATISITVAGELVIAVGGDQDGDGGRAAAAIIVPSWATYSAAVEPGIFKWMELR